MKLRSLFSGLAGLALLFSASTARAAFDIVITVPGGGFVSFDNVLEDDNSAPGQIGLTVQAGALGDLNAALAGAGSSLVFTSLSATSNTGMGGAFANLTVTGEVQGTGTVEIAVSADGYTFPTGGSQTVSSAGSETFTNAVAPGNTFVSYFNPSNTIDARETATGTLVFAPAPGQIVSSSMGVPSSASIVVSPSVVPYSLTNVTTLTISAGTFGGITDVQFQGTTTVTAAVPEPTSMALLVLGGSALAVRKLRRRRETLA